MAGENIVNLRDAERMQTMLHIAECWYINGTTAKLALALKAGKRADRTLDFKLEPRFPAPLA